jgi:hypothetical protein
MEWKGLIETVNKKLKFQDFERLPKTAHVDIENEFRVSNGIVRKRKKNDSRKGRILPSRQFMEDTFSFVLYSCRSLFEGQIKRKSNNSETIRPIINSWLVSTYYFLVFLSQLLPFFQYHKMLEKN